jgi:hypothetical protein
MGLLCARLRDRVCSHKSGEFSWADAFVFPERDESLVVRSFAEACWEDTIWRSCRVVFTSDNLVSGSVLTSLLGLDGDLLSCRPVHPGKTLSRYCQRTE